MIWKKQFRLPAEKAGHPENKDPPSATVRRPGRGKKTGSRAKICWLVKLNYYEYMTYIMIIN
jgi:hypothetical protein